MADPAWNATSPITEFRLWRTYGKPATGTELRLCYDDANLYAFFECEDADVFALYKDRDDNLWESDAVELFFQPDPANPIYYEFEISPNNVVFDARMVNTGSGGFRRWATWNCAINTATSIAGTLNEWHDSDKGYSVEVAIPFEVFSEVLKGAPARVQTWKFAAVRVDLSVTLEAEQRSSTANVPEGDIHNKEGYSTLTFR